MLKGKDAVFELLCLWALQPSKGETYYYLKVESIVLLQEGKPFLRFVFWKKFPMGDV